MLSYMFQILKTERKNLESLNDFPGQQGGMAEVTLRFSSPHSWAEEAPGCTLSEKRNYRRKHDGRLQNQGL